MASAVVALLLVSASQMEAQQRTRVVIDYAGVEGLYLSVGADRGLVQGDTIDVFVDSVSVVPESRLVLLSVTRRRSVASEAGVAIGLGRGDAVYLDLAPVAALVEVPLRTGGPTVTAGTTPVSQALARPRRAQVSGRLAVDFMARETRTSWSGDLSGETRRRFATPTTRLSLTVSDLPGGFIIRTNLRASYRYSELSSGPPPTSIRAYEAAAIKTFDSAPFELRLGRFYNPYESYSNYWDGLLLRVGRSRGPGLGVIAGFEPGQANEGPSTSLPKFTAFADFAQRGDGWRYDTDISVHSQRPSVGDDRLYAGWSQRISVGPLTLSQRLRVDQAPDDGSWSLSQLRVRGGLDVAGPLRINAAFGRTRPAILLATFIGDVPHRDQLSVGVGLYGRGGTLAIDVGRTQREGDAEGRSLSTNAGIRMGSATLSLSGRLWTREEMESISASPGLSFRVGSIRSRVGYSVYRTVSSLSADPLKSQAVDVQFSTALADAIQISIRAQQQWGRNQTGTRLQFGIWRSF